MGSWGSLSFGQYEELSFKSQIPLELLLMFTQDDLQIEEEQGDDGITRNEYRFVTDAKTARRRLDARGLDLEKCRWLYEQFRSDWVWRTDFTDGRFLNFQNTLDFDRYLQALGRVYEEQPNGAPGEEAEPAGESSGDPDVDILTCHGFFDKHAEWYFEDVLGCMSNRCLLEVIPDDTPVELEFSALVGGGYIPEDDIEGIFDYFMNLVLGRIELDYMIYGFVIKDDPHIDARLRERLMSLTEDQFLDHVLRPLLKKMGYENVKTLHFHGPGEFGADILPFRYTTPLGTVEYYAVQAKSVAIHGKSAKSGNAAELISQATQAFNVTFIDEIDNERKRIDKFIIATNKKVSSDARRFIEESVEGRRRLVFLDVDRLVTLVKEHELLRYLLFSEMA